MRKLYFVLFLFAVSCAKQAPEDMIPMLNGYWEIEEVVKPGGEKIKFEINETVDYIHIVDSTGFRTKLKPQLDGTYEDTESKEGLKVKVEKDSLKIYYTTLYNNWSETVLNASEESFEVINDRNIKYKYKKFTPINVTQ